MNIEIQAFPEKRLGILLHLNGLTEEEAPFFGQVLKLIGTLLGSDVPIDEIEDAAESQVGAVQ